MRAESLLIAFRKSGLLKFIPKRLKMAIKSHSDFETLHALDWQDSYNRLMQNVQPAEQKSSEREVCIIHDWMMRHSYYEAACLE